MNKINFFVQDYFVSSRTPEFTWFFYAVTSLFDFSIIFFVIISFFALLIFKLKNINYLILFLSNIFISMFFVYLLKIIFDTERPENSIIGAFGASFPSYHATISTVFFVTIIYIFRNNLTGFLKKTVVSLSTFSIFSVSLSRVYLGVHWLTDVLSGIIIGLVICYFSIKFFERQNNSVMKS